MTSTIEGHGKDIFISYSSIDKTAADSVCSVLEQNGLSCWMAPRNITPGVDFAEAIIDGIRSSKVFVLVYSSNSNNSKQVIREVDRAVDAGLPVINLRLEDVPMSKQLEYYLSSVHWLDATTPPLEEHVNKLSGVVKILLENDEAKEDDLEKAIRDGTLKVGHGKRTIASAGKPWKKAAITMTVLGVLLVVALLIGLPRWKQKISLDATAIGKSIAVLPFTNLSNDPDQEYFSDGMMEEILDRLFKIGDLKVISRTSSMRYKNTDKSIKEIAGELGVASILEGSVRRIGNNVRITVQLIDAKTDAHVWSETYDGDLSDLSRIFIIQSEVAQSVARELKAVLSPQEVKLIEKIPTTDLAAYDYFLKGKFSAHKFNEKDLSLAMQYFEQALERDPDFALAYAGIAYVWIFRQQGGIATPEEAVPKMREAVEKALELDNSLAEVHYMLANLNVLGLWDWEAADAAYKKAIEINPNHAEAHALYALLLNLLGRREEAMKHAELCIQLDPGSNVIIMWYSAVLYYDGQYDNCIARSLEALKNNPTYLSYHSLLSGAFHMIGKYDEAFEATRLWFYNFDHVFNQYKKLGYAGTMNLLADTLFAQSKTKWINPAIIAWMYSYAGNKDRALDCLELAYEMRDVQVIYSGSEPLFAILHDEPRFQEIMRKLNLPINRIKPQKP
jgi:adenylate cyclase